jgi:hypothetical protein
VKVETVALFRVLGLSRAGGCSLLVLEMASFA